MIYVCMNLFVMMECKKKIAVLGHFAECCTRQRTPLPSGVTITLGKEIKKKFKLCRVPARGHSAKNFFLKKNQTLPSAGQGHPAENF